MTTMTERYDAAASRYDRWWAPVLAPTALRLLRELDAFLAARPQATALDIGTGTGTLTLAAARRWPGARIIGTDLSAGMLAVAAARARDELPTDAGRLRFETGPADALPLPDASVDAVMSSFVFQLVPDRPAAMREARRVLRPGGRLAVVTWRGEEPPFEPDDTLDDALDELGDEVPDEPDDDEPPRSGNFSSAAAAAAQVRRAGFVRVRATAAELVHDYDPATYLDFLEQYGERGLFEDLDEPVRRRLRAATARRLARLPREAFRWRMGVVTLTATNPPSPPDGKPSRRRRG
ncbi:MAG TPA: class I SAM-dependent methyltransferase [Candidatus Saccharimonadales bacterium]|nr:class I SAM-dependent methyltransferase [Candidatus Saccharimonadales bacterium]